jgi:hypothetical protein
VIEMRLGGTSREFEGLLSLVTHHRGVTAGFPAWLAAANIRGNNATSDDRKYH